MGLDNRPVAQPRFRLREAAASPQHLKTYTPPQVAQLYNFPTNLNGSGQCIAIIELGGGYDDNAMAQYFTQLGIQPPTLVNVSVDGGQNSPGNDADSEVCLDIQVAGAVAPGAKLAVYFAPNNGRGFIDAITKAIHDTDNQPSIVSISWGGAESPELTQYEQTLNQACQAAALLGVTVCVASGDDGSSDRVNDGKAHVDFPASSP
jgi:kumamolisin